MEDENKFVPSNVVPPELQIDDEITTGLWNVDGAVLPSALLPPNTSGTFFPLTPSTNVTPGSFPLLYQVSPTEPPRQIEVPHTATVADIKSRIEQDIGVSNVQLSFNEKELSNDEATLEEYNIPGAYDAASCFLWTIGEGGLSTNEKLKALNPALAVVNGVRRGETDPNDLVNMGLHAKSMPILNVLQTPPNLAPKSADSKRTPSSADFSSVIGKLGEQMPQLYRKNAVDAMSSALKSNDPLMPPPSAGLARMSSWKLEEPTKLEIENAGDVFTRKPTSTWIQELARDWERTSHPEAEVENGGGNDSAEGAEDSPEEDVGEEEEEDEEDSEDEDGDGVTSTENIDHAGSSAQGSSRGLQEGHSKKVPKKRGRKRKHPELSEDQRQELRKVQNRESAKKSRERKKTMSLQYQEKIGAVMDENQLLKTQLDRLNKRLEMMQQLLTIQVTPQGTNGT